MRNMVILKKGVFHLLCLVSVLIGLLLIISLFEDSNQRVRESTFFKKYSSDQFKEDKQYPCIHSRIIEEEKLLNQPEQSFEIIPQDTSFQTTSSSSDSLQAIRIHFDYSHLAQFDSSIRKFIQTQLIPSAGSFFEQLLKVQPLDRPIKIDPYYATHNCGAASIKIPKDHLNHGIPNADMVFYISAQNDPHEKFLAYASTCPQSKHYGLSSGRPTVGYFNMNLHYLEQDIRSKDPMKISQWIWTTIHEMTHSLVFSPYHFSHYQKERNPFRHIDGKAYITAPTIVKLAQKHFNCDSIDKAPLEDEGGRGTAEAHWERKVFGNELMTGSSMYDSVFSEFTGAMYEISGWYSVNKEMNSTFMWGKDRGCNFVQDECENLKEDSVFCDQKGVSCSYDYAGLAGCQHDSLSDSCNYWRAFSNTHCNYPPEKIGKLFKHFGGDFGSHSRCFKNNIVLKETGKPLEALCFESKCTYSDNSSLLENISNSKNQFTSHSVKATSNLVASFKLYDKWYDCMIDRQNITTDQGYTVECPDIQIFCLSQASCPDSCRARGVCLHGNCICSKGFSGEDCSELDN